MNEMLGEKVSLGVFNLPFKLKDLDLMKDNKTLKILMLTSWERIFVGATLKIPVTFTELS